MIPYLNRFHRRNAVRYVYSKGEIFRSRYITFKVIKNERIDDSRVVVVISKKTLKSAVRRNRVRRRVYAIVSAELAKFNAKYDMALIVTSAEIQSLSHTELYDLVKDLFSQAHLY